MDIKYCSPMKMLFIVFMVVAFFICATLFQENILIVLNKIKGLGWIAPLIFLLLYCIATLLFLPTMLLTLAGGALFGPFCGTLINLFGATLGAACAFFMSRHVVSDWVHTKKGPTLEKLIAGVERKGWQFVALLRLLPIVPSCFTNYGLGITRIKFSHYLITTFVFLIPSEIIYTYCGHASINAQPQPMHYYKVAGILLLFALSTIVLFRLLVRRKLI